jgi:flagellar hook assembly protein FlgD
VDVHQLAGAHQVSWDGRNEKGELATNGIYYYKIINAEFVETQKMLLLR